MVAVFLTLTTLSAAAAPSKPDFSAFSSILQNNVFNTKRSPQYVPSERPTARIVRTESLTLTGTFRDEKGPLAFFDGSRPDYRKVLKPNDSIASFKIADIEHAYVKLKNGTNEVMLPVNMQLSREEEGEWQLGQRSESSSSSGPSVAASSTPPTSESRQRTDRGDRRDRGGDRSDRFRDRRGGSDNGNGTARGGSAASAVPDLPAEAFVPAEAPSAAVSNAAPASVSNSPEDILEILRRRREQENSQ